MWVWVFSAMQHTGTTVHQVKAWIRSQEYLVTLSLLQKESRTCLWMWRQSQGNQLMAKCSSSQDTPVHKTAKEGTFTKAQTPQHITPWYSTSHRTAECSPSTNTTHNSVKSDIRRVRERQGPCRWPGVLEKESHTGQYICRDVHLYPKGVTSSASPTLLKETQQTNKLTDRASSWKAASRWSQTKGCICNAPVEAVRTAQCPQSCAL